LREGHGLRVSENRVLRRISEPNREVGENCIMWNFIICMLRQILLGKSNQGRNGWGILHTWEK
jgi:hypothetical protein